MRCTNIYLKPLFAQGLSQYIDYLTSAKDYNALWVKSLKDLSQIHSEGYRSLGKYPVEVFEIGVKAGSDQLKAISQTKDFNVFAAAQSELMATTVQDLLAVGAKARDLLVSWNAKNGAWFEKYVGETPKASRNQDRLKSPPTFA